MRFSTRYNKFEDWLSTQDSRTGYIKRIARLHSLYPKANLNQLRGHAKSKARLLSRSRRVSVYARSWNIVSPKEQSIRERALEVLSLARRSGQSITKLCREHGISIKAILRATNSFKKVNCRWGAEKIDHISRRIVINENGRGVFIEVNDSRYATTIGKYKLSETEKFIRTIREHAD